MGFKAGRWYRPGLGKPFAVILHQLGNLRRVWEDDWGTGDTAGKRAVDAADFRMAAENDAPMQFAYGRFRLWGWPLPPIRASTIQLRNGQRPRDDRQGLAAHGNAVFDQLRRFA